MKSQHAETGSARSIYIYARIYADTLRRCEGCPCPGAVRAKPTYPRYTLFSSHLCPRWCCTSFSVVALVCGFASTVPIPLVLSPVSRRSPRCSKLPGTGSRRDVTATKREKRAGGGIRGRTGGRMLALLDPRSRSRPRVQMTNTIRLYGRICTLTRPVLHSFATYCAMRRLRLTDAASLRKSKQLPLPSLRKSPKSFTYSNEYATICFQGNVIYFRTFQTWF